MSSFITQFGGSTILIFVGVLLAAIGAVWAAYDQNRFSDKLDRKNEEIIALNHQINASIIGGDSYYYFIPEGSSPCDALVEHVGDYPIYDAFAIITDIQKVKRLTLKEGLDFISTISLGNLAPHASSWYRDVFRLEGTRKQFLIQMSARNGHFYEEIQFIRREERWEWAVKVSVHRDRGAGSGTDVVLEKYSEGFPLTESGTVDWDRE